MLMGEVMEEEERKWDLPLKFHLIALSSLHEVSQMIVITSLVKFTLGVAKLPSNRGPRRAGQ